MTTKLDRPLRREFQIAGEPWVVTISAQTLKMTRKGRRKGLELAWRALVNGDAALAAALNASVLPTRPRRPHSEASSPRAARRTKPAGSSKR